MDILYIFQWWLFIFLIGLVSLPLTSLLFKSFIDKGYLFSKVIGTLVLSYVIFLLGTLHFLPFTRVSLFALFFIIPLIGYVILVFTSEKKTINLFVQNIGGLFKKNWHIFLFEELLFFLTLSFWSYIRAFQPDIHGLEKFMDFGFVNSILRSTYFPPIDMWFTPFPINYYYFGHLTTAVLTKFSDVPSHISYNLMIATLFAYTFSLSFSIGANVFASFTSKFEKPSFFKLTTIIFCGLLAGFLVSSAGNLHALYAFFKPYQNENPVPFWQLEFSPHPLENSYWYPNATRFIYNTIHEFPLYSFVVSDLHGHVLSIPIVLTIIALLFHEAALRKEKIPLKTLLILSFLIAAAYMTNAWDGIIYFILIVMALTVLYLKNRSKNSMSREYKILNIKHLISYLKYNFTIYYLLFTILILGLGFILFSLPFSIFFKPFVSGIGVLCAPSFLTKIGKIGPLLFEENHCQRSPLWQLVILHGFFYFWVIVFLASIFKKPYYQTLNDKLSGFGNFSNWNFFRDLKLPALSTSFLSLNKAEGGIRNFYSTDIFIIILIALSTLLIIIPEFIYAKDIYPAHYRANTMFKLGYEAFIMLSLVSAYSITRSISNFLAKRDQAPMDKFFYFKFVVFAIGSIGLFLITIYPYYAITSYYGNLTDYKTLDGTVYLKPLYPTDYDAILWLNKHITGQPVILEAQGDSYTDFARVSANTGLPTVLGWTVHEWLWRGDYNIPAPRIPEVQTLYESSEVKTVKNIIKKYNVSFVFVGDLERQKYPKLNEEKFKKLGKAVYANGQTTIYQIDITQQVRE